MLILMRRPSEKIRINRNITLTVTSIGRDSVELSLKAAEDLTVDMTLTRWPTGKIRINRDVTVAVTRIGRSSVQLGIEAPKEVVVDREEIHLRKAAQTRARLHTTLLAKTG